MIQTQELKGTFPDVPNDGNYALQTSIWNQKYDVTVHSMITGTHWKSLLSQLFADVPDAKILVVTHSDSIMHRETQIVRIGDMKFRLSLDVKQYDAAMKYRESIAK